MIYPELPQISSCNIVIGDSTVGSSANNLTLSNAMTIAGRSGWESTIPNIFYTDSRKEVEKLALSKRNEDYTIKEYPAMEKKDTRRIVRVFVIDPDINLNAEQALLYKGDELLTDDTDQELFFALGINELLVSHNEKRSKIKDKEKSKEKDVFLEAIKIRDLQMKIVTLVSF